MSAEDLRMCKVHATGLTTDELRELSGFLKDCFNQKQAQQDLMAKVNFHQKDIVSFEDRGRIYEGTILKINQKTATVQCTLKTYNVPLSWLKKVEMQNV